MYQFHNAEIEITIVDEEDYSERIKKFYLDYPKTIFSSLTFEDCQLQKNGNVYTLSYIENDYFDDCRFLGLTDRFLTGTHISFFHLNANFWNEGTGGKYSDFFVAEWYENKFKYEYHSSLDVKADKYGNTDAKLKYKRWHYFTPHPKSKSLSDQDYSTIFPQSENDIPTKKLPKDQRIILDQLDYRRKDPNASGCDFRVQYPLEWSQLSEYEKAIRAVEVFHGNNYEIFHEHKMELFQDALRFSQIFRVPASEFNKERDRETEIRCGYIRNIYMLHAFRSFYITWKAYMKANKKKPETVSINELLAIIEHIEKCGGVNYKISPGTICSGTEEQLFHFYPGGFENYRRNELEVSFNIACEGEAYIDDIQSDLLMLFYPMDQIAKYLTKRKEAKDNLEGTAADILSMWCIIVLATKFRYHFNVDFLPGMERMNLQQLPPVEIKSRREEIEPYCDEERYVWYTENALVCIDSLDNKIYSILNTVSKEDPRAKELNVRPGTKYITRGAIQNSHVKNVILPEGLEELNAEFPEITSIKLPSSLKKIHLRAPNLSSIVLPENVEEVSLWVPKVTDLTIPESVTNVGRILFNKP